MLHYKTIDTKLLELLKKLMQIPEFGNLRLVGGTALALQIGHRNSVDIDLFGEYPEDIDFSQIIKEISSDYSWIKRSRNINIFIIDNIKVDFVNYSYPWLEKAIDKENIRLTGIPDIAAMKINAITGRGAKKDFIDLYFILKKYTLKDILEYYQNKYGDHDLILALKSLPYFEDAEKDEMPIMYKQVDWHTIKKTIKKEVDSFINLL